MSELPPPSFPPPVAPGSSAEPSGSAAPPGGRGWRNPTRTAVVVVLASVVALVVAGFVFIVRSEPSDSSDDTVSFEQRWNERVPALAGLDEPGSIRVIGAYDDVVVIAAGADDEATVVVGVARGTGEQRWDVELPTDLDGGVIGRIVNDQLFVVAGTGDDDDESLRPGAARLSVFDPRSGDELWSYDGLDTAFSWVVVGDEALVATGAREAGERQLVALDRRDGAERWRRPSTGASMPAVVRSNGLVVVDGFGPDATYVGLDLDGDERWSFDADAMTGGADWYPEVTGDVVPLVDGGALIGVDLESGDERWSVDRPEVGDPSEVQLTHRPDLGIVVSCAEGSDPAGDDVVAIAAIDLDDGEMLWDTDLTGERPVFVGVIGDHVFTAASSQFGGGCQSYLGSMITDDLAVVDARTGEPAWEIDADDDVRTMLVRRSSSFTAPYDLLVVARDRTDEVIDLDTGDVLGAIDREGDDGGMRVAGQPANWGDVVVYVEADRDDDQEFTSIVRDANDDEHVVELDGLAQVIGFVDGVLYVRSGSRLVAID